MPVATARILGSPHYLIAILFLLLDLISSYLVLQAVDCYIYTRMHNLGVKQAVPARFVLLHSMTFTE
jgi:NADH:ubiquinone oxidoreductase subunit 3 (subunit A)